MDYKMELRKNVINERGGRGEGKKLLGERGGFAKKHYREPVQSVGIREGGGSGR